MQRDCQGHKSIFVRMWCLAGLKVRKWKDAAAAAAAVISDAQTPDGGKRSHWGRAGQQDDNEDDDLRFGFTSLPIDHRMP